MYFELDGTKYNDGTTTTAIDAKDIGFDLDNEKELLLVTEFHLTRDDVVSKSPPRVSIPLFSPVDKTQPWMNGYREISTEQDRQPVTPFRIAYSDFPSTSELIFDPTSAAEFWTVGSATSRKESVAAVPVSMAWHYSENDRGCYIDLGNRVRLVHSGLLVYPDSYPEATLRRSNWYQNQTQPSMRDEQFLAAQSSPFGSSNLPVPKIASPVDWLEVQNGDLAFDARLPYACYNWEVFFHAPLLIADQLSKQHKFEDAERWLRYVFDPTSTEVDTNANNAKRFLKFRVFNKMNLNQQVIDDLTALAHAAGDFATDADIAAIEKLINRWRDLPFRPFLIARRRHIAFLWRTLFAYLDNLIAWADSLYRRDTIESINEAVMLYVLAERILGRRPKLHKGSSSREALSYEGMNAKWDEFANYWIDTVTGSSNNRPTQSRLKGEKKQPNPDGMLYFCMPFNDKILSYWNTIEARLSNVRNCRNIEGIERKLPLMDAPIDPELLIRATAAGLDLADVIAGLYAPPPHYRYSILSARAAELANEAKSLGAAMLSAIEKRDAEHLAKLRSSNEISLLKLVSEVRKLQITEADRNIEALRGSRKSVESRYNQYQRLIGKKDIKVPKENASVGDESMLGSVDSGLTSNRSSWGLIGEEGQQYVGIEEANAWSVASGVAKTVGGASHAAAGIAAAAGWSDPKDTGYKILTAVGLGASAIGDAFSTVSQGWRGYAEQQGMMASHIRRRDEWAFQSNQTLKEMQQIDKQILANQIRIDITNKELNNHIEQIEQSKAVDEVMRSKFSNEQLYEWMKTELSKLYFNAYRMALEMARKAERAAARELGVKPLNILGNAYWDSLRDGLLAGERLHLDLKRLEVTYLDQNRREYELTKHISLRRLKPEELLKLRFTRTEGTKKVNSCEFAIPEWLFDLDTPGHYLRRIKSVSVSIPCVVGPYTSINCKLTLLKSSIRHNKTSTDYQRTNTNEARFTDYYGASEAIVTSTASGDSGMFETQLRDERFLPFEGSGVISTWRLELPADFPQFDYSTISDAILSIRYTARDGGLQLRDAATNSVENLLIPPSSPTPISDPLLFAVLLSCKSDFPTEWAKAKTNPSEKLMIPITKDLIPYWMDAAKLVVRKISHLELGTDHVMPPPVAFTKTTRSGIDYADLGKLAANTNDVIVVLYVGK